MVSWFNAVKTRDILVLFLSLILILYCFFNYYFICMSMSILMLKLVTYLGLSSTCSLDCKVGNLFLNLGWKINVQHSFWTFVFLGRLCRQLCLLMARNSTMFSCLLWHLTPLPQTWENMKRGQFKSPQWDSVCWRSPQ